MPSVHIAKFCDFRIDVPPLCLESCNGRVMISSISLCGMRESQYLIRE